MDVQPSAGQHEYQPTWESLDQRSTPDWYRDAKFGIFIHWGLYSVPAWSPRGTYAEWYWHALDGKHQNSEKRVMRQKAVNAFHERVYGKDFEYADFRPLFTCEMFEVLTSKHHDGYCLFPNQEANRSFGMAWNSVDSGPKRDLVRDLTASVRYAGLKMGLYYSIWDWFNPYWPEEEQVAEHYGEGLQRYVREVMTPQFKQIVRDYQPSLICSDGDWWMDDENGKRSPCWHGSLTTPPIRRRL
jgi:alpha-L-fucosidase